MGLFGWLFGGSRAPAVRNLGGGQVEVTGLLIEGTGRAEVAVVGESHYQPALWAAVGAPRGSGRVRFDCQAMLLPEPDNQFDRNAVKVFVVGGGHVGYLSREDAAAYRLPLLRITASKRLATCEAVIMGGGAFDDGREGMLGIFLDLPDPDDLSDYE